MFVLLLIRVGLRGPDLSLCSYKALKENLEQFHKNMFDESASINKQVVTKLLVVYITQVRFFTYESLLTAN